MAPSPRAQRAMNAQTASRYQITPEEAAMKEWLSPIPRSRYLSMSDDDLGAEVKRLYVLQKAKASPRTIIDMRLLRFFDPQWIGDTWQNVFTGKLNQKLRHNAGLATDNVPWSGTLVEAMTGLLSGNKPMAYMYGIEPEDPASDADILQADTIEKFLDRWVELQEYDLNYLDHIANIVALGRSWRYLYTDPDTMETCPEVLWPGHVGAFWQPGNRRVEQVTVERQLTLSEAFDLYGTSQENRDAIQNAMRPPAVLGSPLPSTPGGRFGTGGDRQYAAATVLTHWYRLGVGKMGVSKSTASQDRPDPQIGMAAILLYDLPGSKGERGVFTLARHDPTNQNGVTGYEDVPLNCTPRFKVHDKPPDEAYGILMKIAGLHTQYNEVFSAYRDMLWRTIYARYVAKGFTFRNAPKIIPGSAIYALPRTDQAFERIREEVNNSPIEQFLTGNLEKQIVLHSGLNHYFLGNAAPSETSGESITAAINASITQIEPWRTNIERGEKWMYRQVLAQAEVFHRYTYQGRTVTMAAIIEGKRNVTINWRDVTPKDAEKAKRMALEGVRAGVNSRDTAMDEFNIHSKADERRKIRKERQDIVLSPDIYGQILQARMQEAQMQAAAGQGGGQGRAKVNLSGKLTPGAEQVAEQQAGLVSPNGGGGGAPAGSAQGGPAQQMARQGRVANASARTAAARAAPQGSPAMNRNAGGRPGGRMARMAAPPARGQVPAPPNLSGR